MIKALFRRRHRNRDGLCGRESGRDSSGRCCARPLSDYMQGGEVTVISNGDRKTLEMGVCTGATVRIVANRPRDAGMVIAVGEGRYILSKTVAAQIRARAC